jgi:hypothetical protein
MIRTWNEVDREIRTLQRKLQELQGWTINPDFHGKELLRAKIPRLEQKINDVQTTSIYYDTVNNYWVIDPGNGEPPTPFPQTYWDAYGADRYSGTSQRIDSFTASNPGYALWEFIARNGSNMRGGKLMATWTNISTVPSYTEFGPGAMGTIDDLALSVAWNGTKIELRSSSTLQWHISWLRKAIILTGP